MLHMVLCFTAAGCVFDERAVPMKPGYFAAVTMSDASANHPTNLGYAGGYAEASTREWLGVAQPQLEHLLPPRGRLVMLTDQMTGEQGRPRDVYAWFGRSPSTLNKLTKNWNGMVHTGQAVSRAEAIDQPAPPWPGFEPLWIPVAPDVRLHGRLALVRGADGTPAPGDCVVLIPGFLGDSAILRTRDLAAALYGHGFHVLALELRGHGQVEHYYPDLYYNFGVLETQDLLRVSEWLQDTHPCIRNTGMIGFCWGANHVMLAAWFDGRSPDDPSITPVVARFLDPPSGRRHYTLGVMAFSPVLRWEELMDETDLPHDDMWQNPPMFFFQKVIAARMARKGYPEVSGSLRRLIAYDFASSRLGPSFPVREAYHCLRFLPYRGQPDGDKLEFARVPVLMITAVNDPFLSAQDLADLTARTDNPLVASMIMRGGGHIGFAPYNPPYFYSLILNFFDRNHGAAAFSGTRE
ncbi:MAG: alpha/beta fold hydrolase [Planctomycetes bacterium]|nr:alpha/beta fold hydrolase [Planctomycetota bacterium]